MLKRLLITAAFVTFPHLAAGATFVVNSTIDAVDASPGNGVCATVGSLCTLRAAIQEANALAGPHTITLPAGTYTLTIAGRAELFAATGDLNVRANITINGAGAATTIIDANAVDRAFTAIGTGALTLNDVTVQNGDPGNAFGGCLYTSAVPATLTRVVVKGCHATGGGGAVIFFGGTPTSPVALTITDSTITQNTNPGNPGGGVYIVGPSATATISRSTISANSASAGGGIVASSADVAVADSTVNGNTSTDTTTGFGGGLYVSGASGSPASLTVTNSTIAQNVAAVGGGGVHVSGGSDGVVTINRSTISGNSGSQGGGINAQGAVTVANTTISGNTATTGVGGAIFAGFTTGTTVALVNATIASNSSALAGAVRVSAPAAIQARNTIIANSTGAAPGNCSVSAGSTLTSLGNNLEFPGTTCGFSLASDRRADPLLNALANNGGSTQTLALSVSSPAIDAGDDATCAAAPVSGVDQRGVHRPSGSHCDIGAYELAPTVVRTTAGDYDSDSKTDLALYRPSTGYWYIKQSSTNYTTYVAYQWGINGDIAVAGDYDGDGKPDLGLYRPSTGYWYILLSSTNYATYVSYQWGINGDIAVAGDYDGDGKTDLGLYRPSTGYWYILLSSTNYTTYVAYQWGINGDIAVAGDYDGDGKTDLGLYRPSTGYWYILLSSTGYVSYVAQAWGIAGDIPVPGDYDGDGKTDLGLYRPSTGYWYLMLSSTNYTTYLTYQWGINGDVVVPGDYDGDGKTDLGLYRPSTGYWYVLQSSTNYSAYIAQQWGLSTDIPILGR